MEAVKDFKFKNMLFCNLDKAGIFMVLPGNPGCPGGPGGPGIALVPPKQFTQVSPFSPKQQQVTVFFSYGVRLKFPLQNFIQKTVVLLKPIFSCHIRTAASLPASLTFLARLSWVTSLSLHTRTPGFSSDAVLSCGIAWRSGKTW